MNNSHARHAAVLREAAELFDMKNASYQDSWREQGWRGNVSRILEKAKRIRALLWRQSVLLNGSKEHPRETLLDVINTCVFAIINMDDNVEWGEGVDAKPIGPPADYELEQFRLAHGNPTLTFDQMIQARRGIWPDADEPALPLPQDASVPVPGEEPVQPSPRKRPGPRPKPERQN